MDMPIRGTMDYKKEMWRLRVLFLPELENGTPYLLSRPGSTSAENIMNKSNYVRCFIIRVDNGKDKE